jgi:hypothetical protein
MTGLRSGLEGDAWAGCALWDRCSDHAEARAVCLGSRYTSRPSFRTRRQISRAANAICTIGAMIFHRVVCAFAKQRRDPWPSQH